MQALDLRETLREEKTLFLAENRFFDTALKKGTVQFTNCKS